MPSGKNQKNPDASRLLSSVNFLKGIPMSRILHRKLGETPPVAVKGDGIYLQDSQGKTYIDASGGAAVSSLGHGHPDVIAAMHAQIDRCAYAHTAFFTTEAAESKRTSSGSPTCSTTS